MGRTPLSMESYLGKPISPRIIQAVYEDIPLVKVDAEDDWVKSLDHVQSPLKEPAFSAETVFGMKTYLEIVDEGILLRERGLWQCNIEAEVYSEDAQERLAVTGDKGIDLFFMQDFRNTVYLTGRARISRRFIVKNYEAKCLLLLHVANAHGIASISDMKLTVRLIGSEDV